MIATKAQTDRLTRNWIDMSDQHVDVRQIGDTIYGFTTELGALRLFARYSGQGRAEYSDNLETWFFALDLEAA